MANVPYTPAEDERIDRLRRRGFTWEAIAEVMPGRTASGIEARAYYRRKQRPGLRVSLTPYMEKPKGSDDDYVEACLAQGGFPYALELNGQTYWIYQREAA